MSITAPLTATDQSVSRDLYFAIPVTEGIENFPKEPLNLPKTFEFSKPEHGWPPYPLDWTNVVSISAQTIPGTLTDEIAERMRVAALEEPKLREALGERFVHINTDPSHIGKGSMAMDCGEPIGARLMFYSYSNNTAVQVSMLGMRVNEIHALQGYQPAEGIEEINEAICLARQHPIIAEKVALLAAHAILLPMPIEELGYGNRIMWVTFSEPSKPNYEEPALFTAIVDLTTRCVLFTRAEPPIGSHTEGEENA